MSAVLLSLTEQLRQAGLNVTAQRLAVLRAVQSHPHALADEVCEQVRGELGTISRQAVYDALNTMTEHGIIRRIQPAGTTARYEVSADNHHHLVCRGCGRMVDTACATGEAPCLSAAEPHGFRIDEAEVIYWGLCPDCQS
jgi:Fur family ferric uptake transcriptional regulator